MKYEAMAGGYIDMQNLEAVIYWLELLQEPSDHIDVHVPVDQIIRYFNAAGYRENAFCGPLFNSEDKYVFAAWLIGQALAGLKTVGAIHGIFHKFAQEWRAKFASPQSGTALTKDSMDTSNSQA